jgi:IS5 family transposase
MQLRFSDCELTPAKQQTKREKFLAKMDAVVPWQALIDLIEFRYPKVNKKGGSPPCALATMLRIICSSTGIPSVIRRLRKP